MVKRKIEKDPGGSASELESKPVTRGVKKPKFNQREEEDDSESASEEQVSKPKSKAKAKAKASSTKDQKNADGESYIDLGKKKRATVRTFKGHTGLDIREYFGSDDDLKPGKKGINLSLEQWSTLKANADAIDAAFAREQKK